MSDKENDSGLDTETLKHLASEVVKAMTETTEVEPEVVAVLLTKAQAQFLDVCMDHFIREPETPGIQAAIRSALKGLG